MTGAPIAILGIGCRYPGGIDGPDAFWRVVSAGVDATGPIPADRFDAAAYHDPASGTPGHMATLRGGYLGALDGFDAGFFGMSPREAERIDPQQRLLLETAWEALEDAGQDVPALRGSRGGVFVGQWTSDFEALLFADRETLDFNTTNGTGRYAASGRISYLFGWRGPSLTLDTACSSSLAAVHLAVRSLQAGECEIALAGGANVILQPHIHIAYSQGGMMAPDGHCKFGDAARDGYVRSEGAGLVVLKPLAAALRDGDPIRAVILGGAFNNDGDSSGSLGRPSTLGQEELLRAALADADIAPDSVGYVEAHGTGTRAGDPVEVAALAAVFGAGRGEPLPVGSVKTNFGHTEAAAGVAGLIKAVLTVANGRIPPSLHYLHPNPAIPWGANGIVVADRARDWGGAAPRRAGVTSFGISGTNCHILLEQAPAPGALEGYAAGAALLPMSARAPEAVRALAGAYADRIAAEDAPALADLCRSAARRGALEHRAVFDARDRNALVAALRDYAAGGGLPLAEGRVNAAAAVRVGFVLPGQGSQYPGMARELLAQDPVFRAAIERCDAAARPYGDWSIVRELEAGEAALLFAPERIDVLLPVLFALSIGYAAVLAEAAIGPAAVVGHSVGEIAAAHLAGAIDLDTAMRIVCRRAALLVPATGQGTMALVDRDPDAVAAYLAGYEDRLAIAGSNASGSCNISGDAAALAAVTERLTRDGIFWRPIRIDMAAHSPQMDAPARALGEELAGLRAGATDVPFYSTVEARILPGGALDADYWRRNLREPVRFAEAIAAMAADGITHFVELGPRAILSPSIGRTVPAATTIVCGERAGTGPVLAEVAARLWASGAAIDWTRVLAPGRIVPLPAYPWQRERHWPDLAPRDAAGPLAKPPRGEVEQWLYRLDWSEDVATARVTGSWRVAAADRAEAEGLAAALRAAGLSADATTLGALDAAVSPADNLLLIAPDDGSAATLPLHALRAVRAGTRLWFVTRGGQAIGDGRVDVVHGALWGAARVVGEEHPERWGGLIDADPALPLAAQGAALAAALAAGGGSDQRALRHGQRLALRLVRAAMPTAAYAWRPDASYLVTGGLGDVGLQLARAMVESGARRLILAGRTALPERATWTGIAPDSVVGRRIAAVRALEALGASVHVVALDVADAAAVAAFLARYAAEGWPPIRGLVHAAGVLAADLAEAMDAARFAEAIRPKLDAAIVLDRLLPELDLFVAISSTSVVLAQAGQANYAAANAGLDALVADRVARGGHALSIGWAAWRGLGLLADASGAANIDELDRRGFHALDPARAAALFPWLCSTQGHVLVADMDWPTYRAARGGRDATLLAALAAAPVDADAPAAPVDRAGMEQIVRAALGQVLRIAPARIDPARPLGAMGLTSLMAMELRNRLEAALARPLSATLAFNYPTLAALTDHLAGTDAATAAASTETAIAETVPADDVATLSDDDALQALLGGGGA